MSEHKTIVPHCLTCRKDGHTYLDCPEAPFKSVFAGAMGLTDLFGDRERVMDNLSRIHSTDTNEEP